LNQANKIANSKRIASRFETGLKEMIAEEGPPQEILIYSTKASGEFLFQLYMLCDNFNIDFVKKRKPQT